MDKRLEKTELSLKNAICKLILVKPYSEITITELCKEAGINRNTFYLHYYSKDDLIEDLIADIVEKLLYFNNGAKVHEYLFKNSNMTEYLLRQLFKELEEYKKLLCAIEKDTSLVGYLDQFQTLLSDTVEYNFKIVTEEQKIDVLFAISGVLGLIKRWINDEITDTEKIVKESSKIIVTILR